MANAQDIDERLAWIAQLGGPVVKWADSSKHVVNFLGLEGWSVSHISGVCEPAEIRKQVTCDVGLRMLTIGLAIHASRGEDPVRWESTLKLADNRYVRNYGSATDFATANHRVPRLRPSAEGLGGASGWLPDIAAVLPE